jgi:hypothetical protein
MTGMVGKINTKNTHISANKFDLMKSPLVHNGFCNKELHLFKVNTKQS